MATLPIGLRVSARVVYRHGRREFRTAAVNHAAHNFTMPAMSPTMTEGNIAAWKVKEGDSFSAGDVLLEIETDKAQMDVEAQEDGIMAKIMQGDGSKAVKVGSRIAVLADEGDDVSSLDIPSEEQSKEAGQPARKDRPTPQEETAGGIDTTESSESAAEAPPSSKPNADAAAGGAADTAKGAQPKDKSSQRGRAQKQKYPLYPSVQHLLHQKGVSKEDADRIPATGPQGRLLKGDVLAYLGRISKAYPSESSERLVKLSHLDLSNIQLRQAAPRPPPSAAPDKPIPPSDVEIATPISLSAVIATQKRVQDTVGIFLPLSTFIARASELANDSLPLAKGHKATANDLFNSVLGLDKATPRTSRGAYTPEITALHPAPLLATRPRRTSKTDIIDMLAATPAKPSTSGRKPVPTIKGAAGVAAADNVFSVVARNGEENRVQEYLGRMKVVLEKEPGRLVL